MTNLPITKHGFDFKDRTLEFAKSIIRLCKKITRNSINNELVSQLIRASGSVGSNYREANDASSKKDFSYRIGISLREAKEAHYWRKYTRRGKPRFER